MEEEGDELLGFVEDRNPRVLGVRLDGPEAADVLEDGVSSHIPEIRRTMRELQAEALVCSPLMVAELYKQEQVQAMAGRAPCKLLAHHRSFLRGIRAKDKAKAREAATHLVYQALQPEELMVDDLVVALNELKALRYVEIFGCHLLSSEAYLGMAALAICNKVVSIQLFAVPGLNGQGLMDLMKLPSLRCLKATGCSNIYDDDVVAVANQQALSAEHGWQHAKLRELTLSHTKMTILGFHALMSMATGILELGLHDNAFLRPNLQIERALSAFSKNNTVSHLDLSRCVGAPSVLTEGILSCRFLQKLVLQAVPAATDDLIRIVTCGCLHLTHLIVRGCTALSDETILSVSKTAIALIDIRGCPNISVEAVTRMQQFRTSLQDSNLLVTVLHDFANIEDEMWMSNNARAARFFGSVAPIESFVAERIKASTADLQAGASTTSVAATTNLAHASPTGSATAAAAASGGGVAPVATKKRKLTLKASIPSKKTAPAPAQAPVEVTSSDTQTPTASTPQMSQRSTPAELFWEFLRSKVPGCDKLWAVRLEVGSIRESFALPPSHVFRFMSSYQFMPTVVLPDVLRRGAAYVLLERPEHKYILCSQSALKYPWSNKKSFDSVWFDIKFEPVSQLEAQEAVKSLFHSLQVCMHNEDLPASWQAVGVAAWTEVWWAGSLQRLRFGWREFDELAAGVEGVRPLEPLPEDPDDAFQIVSSDQGMVLRDVDGKVYRLASKAMLDFAFMQMG